jgi:hypothetical protein
MGYYKNMLIDMEDDRVMEAKITKLERRIKELERAVQEAAEYFEDHADIDGEGGPNTEMALGTSLRNILEGM